ncbi:MAG: pyruvate kinase [Candidatus Doudnabacteria bacterium RIFCSPHIGHO2_02_FULL_46_11]|uniref:Pyruvate kinase n=1 Tax=Candidatus Doudnabacteria bacterium RIFCSPHIGHO2_02_FULL_46_11 TaxID=1817832 RepID=A0A1F5P879_9BACT|nr:MAG: pyruvate kinase [Candidatus Doudnabacteria bacterium RIFCSPHIGHO2_02_FULL_46_11]
MTRSGEFTKIVTTIGPASFSKTMLNSFVALGVDLMRLNASHGTLDEHKEVIKHIRAISRKRGREVGIILDLPGPKIRLGVLPEGFLLTRSHTVALRWLPKAEVKRAVAIDVPAALAPFIKNRAVVAIDDGKVQLLVREVKKGYALASVLAGGEVTSHKGVSIMGVDLPLPAITAKDEEAMSLAPLVDFVAVSFIKSANDIRLFKKKLAGQTKGAKVPPQVIAKIETAAALKNLDEIIEEVDAIMVARGDLGLSIDPAMLGLAQKEIVLKSRKLGKPVIVATQMLDSMTLRPLPTRAEILDVTNAVIDHVDAVMLSSESASGQYPREAVKLMAHISDLVEKSPLNNLTLDSLDNTFGPEHFFAHFLVDFVQSHRIRVIFNEDGDEVLAKLVSGHRIEAHQVVPVTDIHKARQLNLVWGVTPVVAKNKMDLKTNLLTASKMFRKGQVILVIGIHREKNKKQPYARLQKII